MHVLNNCSGVKVQYIDQRCSGVEVKVLEIGNTQVKFRYLKLYSNAVLKWIYLVTLHHFRSAVIKVHSLKMPVWDCSVLLYCSQLYHNTVLNTVFHFERNCGPLNHEHDLNEHNRSQFSSLAIHTENEFHTKEKTQKSLRYVNERTFTHNCEAFLPSLSFYLLQNFFIQLFSRYTWGYL